MKLGNLSFEPPQNNLDLLSQPVKDGIASYRLKDVLVAEIDAALSDTAAFCEKYEIGLDVSVNCVIVEAKRADRTWYAACLIQADRRIDINGVVRRELGAKKVSFAPMDKAVSLSAMAPGAISPIGLPDGWPVLVDNGVLLVDQAVIGSGIRKSKLFIPTSLFSLLPNAKVLAITK
jgi:prolyl-tRNA editing enzyme YbaK/EbsC (Cys-tRNA(Pro) deacylase)